MNKKERRDAPKISVIIPVYNVEEYLQECLDSVLNQSLKDLEIICVNDGSSDNSLQILQDYAKQDSRIKIINQENKGGGQARNTGLDVASAEYIFFLDSDDYIVDGILEKLYDISKSTNLDYLITKAKAFSNKATPKYLELITSFNRIYENFIDIYDFQITKDNFLMVAENYIASMGATLYKREFIEKYHIRFVTSNILAEDQGFHAKVLVCNPRLSALNLVSVMYRRRPNSYTTKNTYESKKPQFKEAIQDVLDFIEKAKPQEAQYYKSVITQYPFYSIYLNGIYYSTRLFRLIWIKNFKEISFMFLPLRLRTMFKYYNSTYFKYFRILFLPLYQDKIIYNKRIISILKLPIYKKTLENISLPSGVFL